MRGMSKHSLLSRLLGVVLLVQLLVPSSIWHAFAEHEDSHHCVTAIDGDALVGVKHIHCPALELNLPLADRLDDFQLEVCSVVSFLFKNRSVSDIRYRYEAFLFLRGPPDWVS